MRVVPISDNPLFNYKVTITYADLVAAAGAADTTATIAIFPESGSFAAGLSVWRCAMNLITAFDASDSGINSLLLEVGDDGDTDRFLTQTEVAVDGTEILFKASAATTFPHAYVAANTVDAKFTVAGGASPLIDELTSGEVEIYLQVMDLNTFERD